MTFQQELSSWFSPTSSQPLSVAPSLNSPAPSTSTLPFPSTDQKPTVLAFLRHCGCPFAEKTFLNLRTAANTHLDLSFVAVSHSSQQATDAWLASLPQSGSEPANLRVVVDEDRHIYNAWGLGVSGFAHVLAPAALWQVWRMGKEEGIWNRPTESGSRWQTGGAFGVDAQGVVKWGGVAERADELPDFDAAAEILRERVEAKL